MTDAAREESLLQQMRQLRRIEPGQFLRMFIVEREQRI